MRVDAAQIKNTLCEAKYYLQRKWDSLYISIKDFFFPWNVIKLKRLDRSWQETDVRMEEAIFQLLEEYFDGQQPFHNCDYEKKPSLLRHRQLLAERKEDMDPEKYEIFTKLLDHLEWYRSGGLKVTGDGILLAALATGRPIEEAIELSEKHEQQINDRLTFVVVNRKYLWT